MSRSRLRTRVERGHRAAHRRTVGEQNQVDEIVGHRVSTRKLPFGGTPLRDQTLAGREHVEGADPGQNQSDTRELEHFKGSLTVLLGQGADQDIGGRADQGAAPPEH